MNKYVSWRRVSTKKQGSSGLGLAAQSEIINYFIDRDNGELIADYEDTFTGTDLHGCINLKKAIEHAKSIGAILIIAKTDRFRNTIEALQIYEQMGDGNIMFCDLPHTDKFTLTLFFSLAEREALLTSIRTKQALREKIRQGGKIGAANENYHLSDEMKRKKAESRSLTMITRTVFSKQTELIFKALRKHYTKLNEYSDRTNDEPFYINYWRIKIALSEDLCRQCVDTLNEFSGDEFDSEINYQWYRYKVTRLLVSLKKYNQLKN